LSPFFPSPSVTNGEPRTVERTIQLVAPFAFHSHKMELSMWSASYGQCSRSSSAHVVWMSSSQSLGSVGASERISKEGNEQQESESFPRRAYLANSRT
jgi:hypothetical protein